MKYFVYFMYFAFAFHCLVSCHHTDISQGLTNELDSNATLVPSTIIANYLNDFFDVSEVYIFISMSSTNYHQQRLITDLVSKTSFSHFSYMIMNRINRLRRWNFRIFNLIFIDESGALMNVLNRTTVHPFHLFQQYLIVVTEPTSDIQRSLQEIFGVVMNVGLIEVNVLIADEESDPKTWSLFLYVPFIQDCDSFVVEKIGTFEPENYTEHLSMTLSDLFPPKTFRFPGCPLFVSTFPMEPFVILRNTDDANNITYDGLDVTIVNQIAKTLNLVPKYVQAPDKNGRGTLFKNGSATGAMKMVIDGDANMTIGTYAMDVERIVVMAPSVSYMQHSFIFAFLESIEIPTPLAKLMAPFEVNLWISLLALLIISIIFILLSKELTTRWRHFIIGGRLNRTPILNMLSSLIGNGIPNQLMNSWTYFGTFARTLTMLWVIFWLVVRNAYQGALYEHFQSQRFQLLYDRVEKVRNSTVTINIYTAALPFIPVNFDTKRFIKYKQYSNEFTGLEKITSGEWNGVFFTNDFITGYFNLKSRTRVETTRDKVRNASPMFYFQKTSILTSMFNEKIYACLETGLILRWYSEYNQKHKNIQNKSPRKLEISNILAMIEISGLLYLISFIVFILERYGSGHTTIKRVLDYLTY